MKHQERWIKQALREFGCVSRNQAVGVRITRLGAYIRDLRKEGWDIETVWGGGGKDCVYKLKSAPTVRKVEIREVDGKRVAVEVTKPIQNELL